MKLLYIFKDKKIFFFQFFFVVYIGVNLIGGERGLISYFEKKTHENKLSIRHSKIQKELVLIEKRNTLLSQSINLDYLDRLYRQKLKFGKKEEIIIKLK
jgi:cell division protein DivIC